jgi:hypothetical protein
LALHSMIGVLLSNCIGKSRDGHERCENSSQFEESLREEKRHMHVLTGEERWVGQVDR